MAVYHTPALLNDSIDGLNINPVVCMLMLLLEEAVISQAILKQLGKDGKLYAFCQR